MVFKKVEEEHMFIKLTVPYQKKRTKTKVGRETLFPTVPRPTTKNKSKSQFNMAEIDLSAFKTCVTESKKQEDRLKSS